MVDDILELLQSDSLLVDSVSGSDVFSGDDLPGMESVSGGDAPGGGIIYYEINLYALPEEPDVEYFDAQEVRYTLWDKPLEDYSVTEGLLLILVVIAVAVLIWNMIKGGFKWQ